MQEGRAQATLNTLKSRLALNASVQRDGVWKVLPATQLVVGDRVKLSLGRVVAADVHILDGSVLLDQSMLTAESLPVEAGAGADTFSGAVVKRGEATAEVTATGTRTKFGQTAELVGLLLTRTARYASAQPGPFLRHCVGRSPWSKHGVQRCESPSPRPVQLHEKSCPGPAT